MTTKHYNEEYILDLFVRMAHHSTAIEGNSLTQNETADIILNGYISREMKEREFYEVRNYKNVLPLFMQRLEEGKKIDIELIKGFHLVIMQNLIGNSGHFKTQENAIIGADFETTKPYLIPTAMQDWVDNYYYKIDIAKDEQMILKSILESHIQFERIHPFSDGNGRIGRLLIVYSCLEQNIAPIVINKEERDKYISFLGKNDIDGFLESAKILQEKEKDRMQKFLNKPKIPKKAQEIDDIELGM